MTFIHLIVLAGWELRYWVLTTLPFFQGLWLHLSYWMWGNVGVTYKQFGFGVFHSSLLTRLGPISISPPLLGEFCLVLISARLGTTYDPWDTYHHLVLWVKLFKYLSSERPIHQDLMKMYPLYILPLGVVQTQWIKADPQSHLVRKFAGGFRGPLRGLTCAISVSVQH